MKLLSCTSSQPQNGLGQPGPSSRIIGSEHAHDKNPTRAVLKWGSEHEEPIRTSLESLRTAGMDYLQYLCIFNLSKMRYNTSAQPGKAVKDLVEQYSHHSAALLDFHEALTPFCASGPHKLDTVIELDAQECRQVLKAAGFSIDAASQLTVFYRHGGPGEDVPITLICDSRRRAVREETESSDGENEESATTIQIVDGEDSVVETPNEVKQESGECAATFQTLDGQVTVEESRDEVKQESKECATTDQTLDGEVPVVESPGEVKQEGEESVMIIQNLDGEVPVAESPDEVKLWGQIERKTNFSHTIYNWTKPNVHRKRLSRSLAQIASEPAYASKYWVDHRATLLLKLIAGILQHYDYIMDMPGGFPAFNDIIIWKELRPDSNDEHYLWSNPPGWLNISFAMDLNQSKTWLWLTNHGDGITTEVHTFPAHLGLLLFHFAVGKSSRRSLKDMDRFNVKSSNRLISLMTSAAASNLDLVEKSMGSDIANLLQYKLLRRFNDRLYLSKEQLHEENKALALDAFNTIYAALNKENYGLRSVAGIARQQAAMNGSTDHIGLDEDDNEYNAGDDREETVKQSNKTTTDDGRHKDKGKAVAVKHKSGWIIGPGDD